MSASGGLRIAIAICGLGTVLARSAAAQQGPVEADAGAAPAPSPADPVTAPPPESSVTVPAATAPESPAPAPPAAAPPPAPAGAVPAQAAAPPYPMQAPPAPMYLGPEPTERRWYGWQTLAVDGVSMVLLVWAADRGRDSDAIITAGVLGYFLGGPIVHWAHGHVGKGFASLGIRVGVPFVGGAIGAGAEAGSCGDFCGAGAGLGALLGALGAMAVDSAVLAREPVREYSARWGPVVGLTSRSTTLGVAGAF